MLHSENRAYHRMITDCSIDYKSLNSNDFIKGSCKNLSSEGILFTSDCAFDKGSLLDIKIIPELAITGPLIAKIKVIRITETSSSVYEIAGQIEEIK